MVAAERPADVMAATAIGSDPTAPPVRYVLRIPDDTGEPLYVSATRGALNGAVRPRSAPTAPRSRSEMPARRLDVDEQRLAVRAEGRAGELVVEPAAAGRSG